MAICVSLLVICVCFLVVCGHLLLFCGGLWSFAGGLWSFAGGFYLFVVVACFSNYVIMQPNKFHVKVMFAMSFECNNPNYVPSSTSLLIILVAFAESSRKGACHCYGFAFECNNSSY